MNFVHNFEPTSTLKANKGCANICLRFNIYISSRNISKIGKRSQNKNLSKKSRNLFKKQCLICNTLVPNQKFLPKKSNQNQTIPYTSRNKNVGYFPKKKSPS